jgi:phosphocarrier protein HPr
LAGVEKTIFEIAPKESERHARPRVELGKLSAMKKVNVTVPWSTGLHLRTAAELVQVSQRFTSRLAVQLGSKMADPRSILSLVLLSAGLGTSLEIEASGADEFEALQAIEEFFRSPEPGLDPTKPSA